MLDKSSRFLIWLRVLSVSLCRGFVPTAGFRRDVNLGKRNESNRLLVRYKNAGGGDSPLGYIDSGIARTE